MHPKKHYIIIVNYNGGEDILNCLHSITTSKDVSPHIVVVDNASRDQSLEGIRNKFPKIHCIYNTHNIGFAAAANIGARFALERSAKTITFCNPDVVLENNCLLELYKTLDASTYSIVSPIIHKEKTGDIWFAGGLIDFKKIKALHQDYSNKLLYPQKNTFISGCVMAVAAEVFKKIGLFDEQFFLYYEDADFSIRATDGNFSIGLSRHAKAYHKEVSENNKDLKTYHLVYSGLLFFDKHSKGFYKIWFRLHYLLRKIKNKKKKISSINDSVAAAYRDFDKK